nr:MAG TPA: hypothetical protein [Caudoviricetes sp.]
MLYILFNFHAAKLMQIIYICKYFCNKFIISARLKIV